MCSNLRETPFSVHTARQYLVVAQVFPDCLFKVITKGKNLFHCILSNWKILSAKNPTGCRRTRISSWHPLHWPIACLYIVYVYSHPLNATEQKCHWTETYWANPKSSKQKRATMRYAVELEICGAAALGFMLL